MWLEANEDLGKTLETESQKLGCLWGPQRGTETRMSASCCQALLSLSLLLSFSPYWLHFLLLQLDFCLLVRNRNISNTKFIPFQLCNPRGNRIPLFWLQESFQC